LVSFFASGFLQHYDIQDEVMQSSKVTINELGLGLVGIEDSMPIGMTYFGEPKKTLLLPENVCISIPT
jgi:hypothetical protein